MHFQDISTDLEEVYRLKANERVVFFILNRTGEITIELAGPGAVAHIFAFYSGAHDSKQALTLVQKHLAPDTVSSALVKTTLDGKSSFHYDGTIRIDKLAHRSDASQESRALILSPDARAYARPALEILAHDVRCHHAATTAPLSEEALFFAQSRGLSRQSAHGLLIHGFFQEALEQMEKLGIETTLAQEKLLSFGFSNSRE